MQYIIGVFIFICGLGRLVNISNCEKEHPDVPTIVGTTIISCLEIACGIYIWVTLS